MTSRVNTVEWGSVWPTSCARSDLAYLHTYNEVRDQVPAPVGGGGVEREGG